MTVDGFRRFVMGWGVYDLQVARSFELAATVSLVDQVVVGDETEQDSDSDSQCSTSFPRTWKKIDAVVVVADDNACLSTSLTFAIVSSKLTMADVEHSVFTETSAYSLAAVAMIGFTASTAANAFLPENARWQDRLTFIWLVSSYVTSCRSSRYI